MDREETLARALCRADGLDPDEAAAPPPTAAGTPADGARPSPGATARWHAFRSQARDIIATFERLTAES